jgi:hypothetical protein
VPRREAGSDSIYRSDQTAADLELRVYPARKGLSRPTQLPIENVCLDRGAAALGLV